MDPFVRDAAVIVISPVLIWGSALSSLLVSHLYLPAEYKKTDESLWQAMRERMFRKKLMVPICVIGLALSFLFTHYAVSKVMAVIIFGAGLYATFSGPKDKG